MPLILAFDTSGAHVCAAVCDGDQPLAQVHHDMAKGQAEQLFDILEDVLKQAHVDWHKLDAIGVGIGPGNFTGIRISVAAARGLALSLNCPAIGVSTLEAQNFGQDGPILSLVPAPRGQVYAQGFDGTSVNAPKLVALDDVETGLPWVSYAVPHANCQTPTADLPCAIAALAHRAFVSGGDIPPATPLYIKPADAAPPAIKPPKMLPA